MHAGLCAIGVAGIYRTGLVHRYLYIAVTDLAPNPYRQIGLKPGGFFKAFAAFRERNWAVALVG